MTVTTGRDHRRFADRVGTTFALRLPDGDHASMVLADCSVTGPGSFALTFHAGPTAPVEQAMYDVSADGFTSEPMFLVPVAHRPDEEFPLEYQAIFNSPLGGEPNDDPDFIHRLEKEAR